MARTRKIDDEAARRDALLAWYAREHRKLPWRTAPGELADPYRTLVSEAMLQQTQVATVIAYFERFVGRFATVHDLAAADEGEVLRLWQGLGYYRRARHLHRAAQSIVGEYSGVMPSTADSLRRLPGVGAYTAGAVASIAFGEQAPLVDGNVARVLARWYGYDKPVDAAAGKKWVWARAGELIARPRHAGDWNQALMELGATVCTPRSPACATCPVARWCAAKRDGLVERLPVTGERAEPVAVTHRVVAVERRGRWLMEQRGDGGLWAGMWQMPTAEGGTRKGKPASVHQKASAAGLSGWVRERFGIVIGRPVYVGGFEHRTTHRLIRFDLWRAKAAAGRRGDGPGAWRRRGEMDDLAMANPQRRVLAMLAGGSDAG